MIKRVISNMKGIHLGKLFCRYVTLEVCICRAYHSSIAFDVIYACVRTVILNGGNRITKV